MWSSCQSPQRREKAYAFSQLCRKVKHLNGAEAASKSSALSHTSRACLYRMTQTIFLKYLQWSITINQNIITSARDDRRQSSDRQSRQQPSQICQQTRFVIPAATATCTFQRQRTALFVPTTSQVGTHSTRFGGRFWDELLRHGRRVHFLCLLLFTNSPSLLVFASSIVFVRCVV